MYSCSFSYAQSEVHLSIKAGGSSLIGVGIGGFDAYGDTSRALGSESALLIAVKNTIIEDLNSSGFFNVKTMPDSMKTMPGGLFAQWQAAGAKCYLLGEPKNNSSTVLINLIDLKTATTILNEEYRILSDRPWYTGHVIVDDMIELLTGLRGSMASQIAFIYPSRGASNELFIIDADSRRRRQLTYTKTLNLSPCWSPDGRRLVFSSLGETNWALCIVDVNTGQNRDISNWPGMNTAPAWCTADPDIIAFSSSKDGNSEVYTCQSNGKKMRRITNHFRIDSSPSWSPDGKQITFTSDRAGQPAVYIMNSDGTDLHRLTSRTNPYEDSPCWSPRGDRIAYVIMFDRTFDIAIASPGGGDEVIITNGEGSNENPKWSPDGLRILFTSTRTGGENLYIMNADGTNVRLLTKDGNSFSPTWAPTSSGNDIRVTSKR